MTGTIENTSLASDIATQRGLTCQNFSSSVLRIALFHSPKHLLSVGPGFTSGILKLPGKVLEAQFAAQHARDAAKSSPMAGPQRGRAGCGFVNVATFAYICEGYQRLTGLQDALHAMLSNFAQPKPLQNDAFAEGDSEDSPEDYHFTSFHPSVMASLPKHILGALPFGVTQRGAIDE